MKKILILAAIFSVLTVSVFAQSSQSKTTVGYEKDESKWSTLSYVNVPILKIMDSTDGYLVIYQKNRTGVGSIVLPKSWAKGTPDAPRKLKFRDVNSANDAYLTIMKDNGEFLRVVVNVPVSRSNYIWGITERGTVLEGVDKDTLEELEL